MEKTLVEEKKSRQKMQILNNEGDNDNEIEMFYFICTSEKFKLK